MLTLATLKSIGGPKAATAVCGGILDSMAWLDRFGISQPQRLAHFLAQVGEESDHFHTTREYASGAAYEGRKDLGNVRPGDGIRFAGRGLIQVTGRTNYRSFTAWIGKVLPGVPDFEVSPALLEKFPWAFYSAVWYWMSHDLNRLADDNNIETITRKINGGLNGLGERIEMFSRSALVLLGYGTGEVKVFQAAAKMEKVDGIVGLKTRTALFEHLKALPAPATPAAPLEAPEAPAIVRPPPAPQPAPAPPPAQAEAPYESPSPWKTFLAWLRRALGG